MQNAKLLESIRKCTRHHSLNKPVFDCSINENKKSRVFMHERNYFEGVESYGCEFKGLYRTNSI